MSASAEDLDQARRLARAAARRGRPLTVCPWPVQGTPRERVLALAFIRTWLAENDDATDYGD